MVLARRKGAHIRDGGRGVNQRLAHVLLRGLPHWRAVHGARASARLIPMDVAALTSRVQRSAAHPLFPAAAIAGLGIALLAGAFAFEYFGGLKPCPLCLEQRWPWRVLIAIGAAILAAHSFKTPSWVAVGLYALAAAVALYGAYLAGYHAGIEYKWWLGPAECTGGGIAVPGDGGLLEGLSSAEIVFCDKVAWSMLGISMAGYNFLFSLAAVALAVMGGLKGMK